MNTISHLHVKTSILWKLNKFSPNNLRRTSTVNYRPLQTDPSVESTEWQTVDNLQVYSEKESWTLKPDYASVRHWEQLHNLYKDLVQRTNWKRSLSGFLSKDLKKNNEKDTGRKIKLYEIGNDNTIIWESALLHFLRANNVDYSDKLGYDISYKHLPAGLDLPLDGAQKKSVQKSGPLLT